VEAVVEKTLPEALGPPGVPEETTSCFSRISPIGYARLPRRRTRETSPSGDRRGLQPGPQVAGPPDLDGSGRIVAGSPRQPERPAGEGRAIVSPAPR
jgi:hypothetical protein